MTEKRFTLEEWDIWDYADGILVIFKDGEFINNKDVVDLLNELATKCSKLEKENEHYKSIFFELVETALTDKNCRELYCKGILDIFDKANSLNQARDMIKEHLK